MKFRYSQLRSSIGLPTAFTITIFAAAVSQLGAQTITWANTGASTAWYTAANWSPSTASGAWLTSNIAQFANAGSATTAGINLGTAPLSIGAIEVTSARTRALTIGNSSGTTGNLTLNGTTVNSVNNVILRNASGSTLTLQDNETGTGKTMGVVLGNATDNRILLDGAGNIVITSTISGAGRPLSVSGSGAGQLVLSTGNTYTGKTTLLTGGTASVTGESAFGANPAAFVADQVTFNGGTLLATGNVNFSSNRGITVAAGGGTLNAASGQTITLTNAVAGSGLLTKTGTGTLSLTTAQSGFSGGITHNAGIVNVSNAAGLGTGTFTFGGYNRLQISVADGASMTVANNMVLPSTGTGGEAELIRVGDATPTAGTTARLTGVISGGASGAVFSLDSDQGSNHNNTLVLDNAANTFTGTLELWRGALAITSDGALGNVNNTLKINNDGNNGGLRFDAANITTAATRTFNLVASEKIDTNGNNARIDGVLSGVNFTKVGAGTLTLAGTNTYTGTTTVNAGTLALSGGVAIANTSAVTLANTAGVTLQLDSSETIASVAGGGTTGGNINLQANTLSLAGSAATSFAGTISGTGGAITKTSTSTGILTLTGTNTYTGGTNLNGGALSISNGSALGTGSLNVNLAAGATFLTVTNTAATDFGNAIALPTPGSAQLYVLQKNAASASTGTQLNLTGDLSGGNANSTLRLTSGTTSDSTTTYRLAGNNSFQGNLELFRGAIVVTNNNSLGSAKLLLNGNNNTTLGDLRFENSVTLANDIDLFNTANPDPIHTGGNTVTLSGVISATGDENLVKIGAGTLILTGTNTYDVGTSVSAGTLLIDGDQSAANGAVTVASGATLGGSGTVGGATTIQTGGHLAVGTSPGTQTFESTLAFQTGSIFDWEINAATSDSGTSNQGTYDQVIANGAVSGTSVFTVALGTNVFADAFWDTSKSWSNIFTGTGTYDLASIFTTFGGSGVAVDGFVFEQGQFTFSGNTLNWSAVPEPTSALAGLLITAGLLRRRRVLDAKETALAPPGDFSNRQHRQRAL